MSDGPSAAAVALVEPWATVEAAYARDERHSLKPGGQLLVVAEAGTETTGLPTLLGQAHPVPDHGRGPGTRAGRPATRRRQRSTTSAGASTTSSTTASDAGTVERLSGLLGNESLLCVVLGGRRLDRRVQLDVGRVHYDFVRYIGTTGTDASEAYRQIPASGEIRPGDTVAIIGAAGPMGLMHTMRAAVLDVPGISIDATDLNDARLRHLAEVVAPAAAQHGVPVRVVNSGTDPLVPGYTYLTCLVPVPGGSRPGRRPGRGGRDRQCVRRFPGRHPGRARPAAHHREPRVPDRHLRFGDEADLASVLRKVETGVLDTAISLDAITGMAGFADAIASVIDRTSGGKIMVYPQLHDQGLVRLVDLADQLPHVAALLQARTLDQTGRGGAAGGRDRTRSRR